MDSATTKHFQQAFQTLPKNIQDKARRAYHFRKTDPCHPSLQFQKIHSTQEIYSVRIGLGYKAIGTKDTDTMIWFWIGSHSTYNLMVSKI